ncbi:nli interacting factor family phosphatase [Cyclospora cayetanensis]|uniref:protein-serine/threonine phosphatase n=1 Tax=Cyclospora cayetanensis TaxID=88456 RepID=A0A1D3D6N9_9EIME|nr:nli interacting factor family phosphatase [Cyclospora cayetanensis]
MRAAAVATVATAAVGEYIRITGLTGRHSISFRSWKVRSFAAELLLNAPTPGDLQVPNELHHPLPLMLLPLPLPCMAEIFHRSVIKLRPGSITFLREMSRYFELFLYTMGTATHAKTAETYSLLLKDQIFSSSSPLLLPPPFLTPPRKALSAAPSASFPSLLLPPPFLLQHRQPSHRTLFASLVPRLPSRAADSTLVQYLAGCLPPSLLKPFSMELSYHFPFIDAELSSLPLAFGTGMRLCVCMRLCVKALRLLDPSGRFFASRVFSRGDSVGGLKRIRRIFPTERKLALAVDDLEFMWEDTSKCIKVEGYFFFEDPSAGDVGRLAPETVSQWLGAARPFCNFLPSVRTRKATTGERWRKHSSAAAVAIEQETHAEALAQQQREQREERELKEQQVMGAAASKGEVASPCEPVAAHTAEGATPNAEIRTATDDGRGSLPQGASETFLLPRPIKKASGASAAKPKTADPARSSSSGSRAYGGSNGGWDHASNTRSAAASPSSTSSACRSAAAKGGGAPRDAEEKAVAAKGGAPGVGGRRAEIEGPFSPSFFQSSVLRDSDRQLAYLMQILKGIHYLIKAPSASGGENPRERVGLCRRKNRLTEDESCPIALSVLRNLPDVSWVLQAFRQQALRGTVISSTGVQGRHLPRLSCTDLGRLITVLGGTVSDDFTENCTHLLCTKEPEAAQQADDEDAQQWEELWEEGFSALGNAEERPLESAFDFRQCEGIARCCWEPEEGHDPLKDDIYGPVIKAVDKAVRRLQKSSYLHLSEALHGLLKPADLGASGTLPDGGGAETAPQGPPALAPQGEMGSDCQEPEAAQQADDEDAQQWEELWEEGFSALGNAEE